MIHGEKIFAGLLLDVAAYLKPAVPCNPGYIVNCIAALFKNIRTICKDSCSVIYGSSVMNAVYSAVGQFLGTKIAPVNVSARKILPCAGIVAYILLDPVILEQNNVGKRAVIACLCRVCNSILYIR